MKFAVTADSHVSYLTWARHPQIRNDGFWGVECVLAHCIKNNLPLLHAGDMLDKENNRSGTFMKLVRLFKRATKEGFQGGIVIEGNHDPLPNEAGEENEPWVAGLPGLEWACNASVELCPGWKLRAVGHRNPQDYADVVQSLRPDENILMIHQSAVQLIGFPSSVAVDLDALPASVRVVIVGDTHVPAVLKNKHGATILSPGSTKVTKEDEVYEKFVYELDLKEDGEHEVTRVRLPTRTFASFTVTDQTGLDCALAKLAELRAAPGCTLKPVVFLKVSVDLKKAALRLREAALAADVYPVISPVRVRMDGVTEVAAGLPWQEVLARSLPPTSVEFEVTAAVLMGAPAKESLQRMRRKAA